MSTKIPRFGFKTENEKATSSSKYNVSETRVRNENNIIKNNLEIGEQKFEEAQKKKIHNNVVKIQVPRVAFIKQGSMGSSIEAIRKKNQQMDGRIQAITSNRKNTMSCTNSNQNKDSFNLKMLNGKNEYSVLMQNLSFRQKSLINERESRLEKSKLRLKKLEDEFSQLELSFKTSESELKLQLEYLEEENQKCIQEKIILQKFENELKIEIKELEDQLDRIDSFFRKHKCEIDTFRNLNNELTQKISEIEETIKLLSKEVFESEKSISLYEVSHLSRSVISENFDMPFNDSVKFALKLEKLLQNDKMTLNQLQFKLHKFKNEPRFVLRNYLAEIPQTSKIFIFIPSPERNSIESNIEDISKQENDTHCGVDKNNLYLEKTEANIKNGFFIDVEKKQIIIDNKYVFEIDKVIEFDETKRPSSLLLTDLSIIQRYLSNIIEERNIENTYLYNYSRNDNKNIFLKRQSLLCNRIEIESPKTNIYNSKCTKTTERNDFYEIDITEQKEVEIDVLLLVNDTFNNIKLGLDDKMVFNNKEGNRSNKIVSSISPICFVNIGMDNTASRKTFWGTNRSRCVFINDFQDNKTKVHEKDGHNKIKTPGILHSVIHQICQNINNSSLIEWDLSSNIIIQKPDYQNYSKEKSIEKQKEVTEKHFEFPGGLKGYLPLLCNVNSFDSSNENEIYNIDPPRFNYKISNVSYSKEIKFEKNSTPKEFISEIYKVIEAFSPNFLYIIDAYDHCIGEKKQQGNINKDFHVIIDLKLEANTGNFSVNSNIVLVDLFIDTDCGVDKYVESYFQYVKGMQVNDNFIQHLQLGDSENKNKPLIYTLVHSNL
ncbi:hypothetical protein FG386_001605 [Cryptosporidium ryanae]|uniref:uncharacterized protein n=1 Tax=Cryptosporidium ryanae TaxID=515981 RepID=UPI003519F7C0|nr:hypothetical protein FG386_001605 [Cryptosporidium ryanae]